MRRFLLAVTITWLLVFTAGNLILAHASPDLGNIGTFNKWSKVEIVFTGPNSVGMSDSDNPFKILVDVRFTGPGGETFDVPAFYDGNGVGGLNGNVWKVRFSPSAVGTWSFSSTSAEPLLDGYEGSFNVIPPTNCSSYDPGDMPDFSCLGRLEWVGEHYLKFVDGPYWLKSGADDPEDFLAPGVTVGFGSKEQAIDYLASKGLNSLYFMTHNIDGDKRNVWPWVGATPSQAKGNHEHFDVEKLGEWESIFEYMQAEGLVLHFVLEDDSGWTGFNRQMYYREMIARFGHHNGLIWNVSEEYNENYSSSLVKSFAQMIQDLDAYDHPTTVHHSGSLDRWDPFVGDNRFDLTSFHSSAAPQNTAAASWFQKVEDSGRTIGISFDEVGDYGTGADNRALARHIMWSLCTGGSNFEIHTAGPYEDYAEQFEDMRRARSFMEDLPFWLMRPENDILESGTGYVLAKSGEAYVVYLPSGDTISLDLSSNTTTYEAQWYNPRDGSIQTIDSVDGGGIESFTAPNSDDWVLLLQGDPGGGNEPPVAEDETVTTAEVTAVEITLTYSDSDGPGPYTFTIVRPPTHGVLSDGSSDELVLYTPTDPTYTGTDTFTWKVNDGLGDSNEATVIITVEGVAILLSDSFARADSNTVGNGWIETEEAGAEVGILNNNLHFIDTADNVNHPMVTHPFAEVSSGKLVWEFDFDWARTGSEGTYRLFMQLGSNSLMTDANQDAGVGVNLIWTSINGIHQSLGYRQSGVVTSLTELSGAHHVTVEVDLDLGTYEVAIDGSTVQSDIALDNGVALDTVRFFTDALNEQNFSGRNFDHVLLSGAPSTPPNQAPVVSITAPANGSSFTEGSDITFSGSADDTEDGDLTISLAWSSNLDGDIGTGGSFSTSSLSVGTHTITATVTDSGVLEGSASITATVDPVPNTAPVVSITAPVDGSSFTESSDITFSGSADDTEDGDLTISLAWSSNLDGDIGTGGSFSTSSLSVGTHTITATVTDSGVLEGSASITATVDPVPNTAPVVSITAPVDGSSFTESSDITFSGSADDTEDGDLTISLAWSSNLDGDIGTGGSFSTSSLSVGTHTITATVTDSGVLEGSASITATVDPVPNTAPVVSITAPVDGSSFTESSDITFSGSADDTEDGDLTISLAWSSNLDGDIGTGGSFSTSSLSVGTHTITATVTDSGVLEGSASITATVDPVPNTAPVVSITAPADGSSFTESSDITFSGSADDTEDGDLTISLAWSSNLDGDIGTGGFFSNSTLSVGTHTITATVTDSGTLEGSASITVTVDPVPNTAPVVSITAPANGSSFTEGSDITFSGSADDTEDGDLTISLAWSSNLDGDIGTGGSFSTSTLSVGTHTITATVTDSGVLEGSASITVTVDPVGQIVHFSDPFDRADGDTVGNGWSEFEQSGAEVSILNDQLYFSDTSDSVNRPMVAHEFAVVSSGNLIWDFDFDWSRTGSEGTYRLFMQLGDGAQMSVDNQDEGVGVNLIWTRIDGVHERLGYRQAGVATSLTELSGRHHVTVEVDLDLSTYSVALDGSAVQSDIALDNAVVLDTVRLFADALNEVNFGGRSFDNIEIKTPGENPPGNQAPEVSITAPADGLWVTEGSDITFSGTADDAEDGDLTSILSWTSDLDGVIGSAGSFSIDTLSVGTHTVTATVTDTGGLSDSASITVTVDPVGNTAPGVSITAPADGLSVTEGSDITFSGTADDAEDGDLTSILSWSSDLDGVIGSGGFFSATGLSVGTHIITASVTDSGGLADDDSTTITVEEDATLPFVDVWYGNQQFFGRMGVPQRWVNILGNVSDADGVTSLTYSLNGGPELPLSIGPDDRRLEESGDFNMEIDYADLDLVDGVIDQVVIRATDSLDNVAVETIYIDYDSESIPPTSLSIDWSTVANIQDVAQIVDGQWTLESDGIRTVQLGYDRIVAIGDILWTDYEVTVPITIHGIDPIAFDRPFSGGPGLGVMVRWPGHYDWDGSQPRYGYQPFGANAWYEWYESGDTELDMGGEYWRVLDPAGRVLDFGIPYIWKLRVQTAPSGTSLYNFKLWEAGQPEPQEWQISGQEEGDLTNGGVLLIAHHVDASFGNVNIVPLTFTSDIVTINSPGDYEVANLQVGDAYYLDRDYTLISIPSELSTGLEEWIRTRNDDKENTADSFLEFTISQNSAVYVAYDNRASFLPFWLENTFVPTALTIEVSDDVMDHFDVFEQTFSAGTINLGGNLANGAAGSMSNYLVIVQPLGSVEEICDNGIDDDLDSLIDCVDPDCLGQPACIVNQPPQITSALVATATEGVLYSYDVEATDPDVGDVLTFSLDDAPFGMSIDSATGLIQWTPTIDQLGDNDVIVRVTDTGGLSDIQSFTITVDSLPPANQAPQITSTPPTTASEGVLYSYDVEATDPDVGDVLTFSLDDAPFGMSIDSATGLIQWTPAIDQLGDNEVVVRVTDVGGLFDVQGFTIAVAEIPALFSDDFDRSDGNSVGNGWSEIEQSGATVGILNGKLYFSTASDSVNRPMVTHQFAEAESGMLVWEFDFDWTRTGSEGTYRLFMQLGDSAQMTDDDQDGGVGVNLIWTKIDNVHQSLGYREGGVVSPLTVLSGPHHVRVEVDLDRYTYEVAIDGSVVLSDIAFDNAVNVNAVRLFADALNEQNFSGRSFDLMEIRPL